MNEWIITGERKYIDLWPQAILFLHKMCLKYVLKLMSHSTWLFNCKKIKMYLLLFGKLDKNSDQFHWKFKFSANIHLYFNLKSQICQLSIKKYRIELQ